MLSDETHSPIERDPQCAVHRVATAGRSIQYQGPLFLVPDESALAVTQWTGNLRLNMVTLSLRYDWLKETINQGVEATAVFTVEQSAYTEDQLPSLA
jgi:hypothetical protein